MEPIVTGPTGSLDSFRRHRVMVQLHSYSSLSDFHDFGLFTDPPVSTISALPANPSVSFNTGTFEMLLNSTDSNVDADTDLLLFASPPTSQGRQTWHGPIPFMFHLGASKPLPSAFETPYNDLFPGGLNPAAKQICFVRIQAINTHFQIIHSTSLVPLM